MKSGSYREGFRFKLLDVDIMIWFINIYMIFKLLEVVFCNFLRLNIIFMEYFEILLGFVRLIKFLYSEKFV